MTSYNQIRGIEYYEKHNNEEVYAINNFGKQIYAKNKKTEFYAKDKNGEFYYAKDGNSEYYAKNRNKDEIYLKKGNKEYYAKDSNNEEIYAKKANGEDIIALENNNYYYAKDKNENERYPKDKNGNEFKLLNTFAKLKSGIIIYPKSKDGQPIHDKNSNGDEVYYTDSNGDITFAVNACGEEVYAKNKNLDEYYPVINNKYYYARDSNGRYKYAKMFNGTIIYPIEGKNEIYIIEKDIGSYNLLKSTRGFVSYVKKGKVEIYPTLKIENGFADMIVDDYAKNIFTNEFYYPTDTSHNEYTNKNGDFIEKLGYPITNDGYIIVPNINNKPKFIKNNKDITEKDIKYILLRQGFNKYDFLTDKLSFRKSQKNSINYSYIPYKANNFLFYIIAALVMGKIELVCPLCRHHNEVCGDKLNTTFSPHSFNNHMKNEHDKIVLTHHGDTVYVNVSEYNTFLNLYGKHDIIHDFLKFRIDFTDSKTTEFIQPQIGFSIRNVVKSKCSSKFMFIMDDFKKTAQTAVPFSFLLNHQKFFLSYMQNFKVHGRKIVVVCDPVGNSGKSTLYNYCTSLKGYLTNSCTMSELYKIRENIQSKYSYVDFFNNNENHMTVVLNISKCISKKQDKMSQLAEELENLVDGNFTSGVKRKIHSVLILTNWSVDFASQLISKLSSDRVEIFEVVEKTITPKTVEVYRVVKSSATNMVMESNIVPVQTFHYINSLPPSVIVSLIKNHDQILEHLKYQEKKALSSNEISDASSSVEFDNDTYTYPNLNNFYDSSCVLKMNGETTIFHRSPLILTPHDESNFESEKLALENLITEQKKIISKNQKYEEFYNTLRALEKSYSLMEDSIVFFKNYNENIHMYNEEEREDFRERARELKTELAFLLSEELTAMLEKIQTKNLFDFSWLPKKTLNISKVAEAPSKDISICNTSYKKRGRPRKVVENKRRRISSEIIMPNYITDVNTINTELDCIISDINPTDTIQPDCIITNVKLNEGKEQCTTNSKSSNENSLDQEYYYTVATNSNMLLVKPDDNQAKETATNLILDESSVPFPEDLMNVFENSPLQTSDNFIHITSSGTYTVPTQPVPEYTPTTMQKNFMSPEPNNHTPSPVKENLMSPVPKPHTYTSSNYVSTNCTTASNALQDTLMMSSPPDFSVYQSPVPRSPITNNTLRQSPDSHSNGKNDDDLESEAGFKSQSTEYYKYKTSKIAALKSTKKVLENSLKNISKLYDCEEYTIEDILETLSTSFPKYSNKINNYIDRYIRPKINTKSKQVLKNILFLTIGSILEITVDFL
ncbi:hypothetical protein NPIL_462681 [Nephila pilipes]|uniref:Uncharacterized protein n=1 Tax=Nephila pilipes TaxID=299642 RepID=A0A8X6N2D0_NEPPI|nr:hypothetical protein NPIL_462681 [Nephila pilipes]